MDARDYEGWVRGLRPVRDEQPDRPARCVAGAVPRELRGTLYRCGPSQRILPPEGQAGLHLFDGDGLVQKLRFSDGQVTHGSRFVRTASFMLEQQSGVFNQHALGARARQPIRGLPMRQQQNTNVVAHAGRLLALVESAAPVELRFDSLRRVGEQDFGIGLAGRPLSAHPKRPAGGGELLIHGCYPRPPYLQLHCIDRAGARVWSADVELGMPAWVHDIAVTERYVVIPVSPVAIEVAFVDGQWVPTDPYRARLERALEWIVCSRQDGRTCARLSSDERDLVVHVGRAFEEGDALVVEAVSYGDATAYLDWLKVVRAGGWVARSQARYRRHRLELASGRATAMTLVERATEFPRVDERVVGRRGRYTYVVLGARAADDERPAPWSRVARLDAEGDRVVEHVLPPGVWPGEPVFVPRRADAAEDDGWLLVLTYDAAADRSELVILDASALASPPVAVVALPARVPFGFHGSFVPAGAA